MRYGKHQVARFRILSINIGEPLEYPFNIAVDHISHQTAWMN